jgi:hypothetical protein
MVNSSSSLFRNTPNATFPRIVNPRIVALFARHAAATYDKQCTLNERIRKKKWHFDMNTGVLRFGDEYQWRAQVLGTQDKSGMWLWAWANTKSRIPEHLLDAAKNMQRYGDGNGIAELCTPRLQTVAGGDGDFYIGNWCVLSERLLSG